MSTRRSPRSMRFMVAGGKCVGKSYLLSALVYRLLARKHRGAMTRFMAPDAIRLYKAYTVSSASPRALRTRSMSPLEMTANYKSWVRLVPTPLEEQAWYRLSLPYLRGLLGRSLAELSVEFFEGSGELMEHSEEQWPDEALDADVVMFCLPLWVPFPRASLAPNVLRDREEQLESFARIVGNYQALRDRNRERGPVLSIVALTMADDQRCSQRSLQDRWIYSYMEQPARYLSGLQTESGVARYFGSALRVSDLLHDEFAGLRDANVASIPERVSFGGSRAWLVPISSIDGSLLEEFERDGGEDARRRRRLEAPVPVHVELPLLIALAQEAKAFL